MQHQPERHGGERARLGPLASASSKVFSLTRALQALHAVAARLFART
jgi:hypothetical protein